PAPTSFYLLATNQRIVLPTNTATSGFESQYRAAYARLKWLNCPAFPIPGQAVCFVVNAFDPNNIGNEIGYMNINRIKKPSSTINFCDGNQALPADNFALYDLWSTNHIMQNPNPPAVTATPVTSGSGPPGRILTDKRHGGKINMSFYDQHVEWKDYKKVDISDF